MKLVQESIKNINIKQLDLQIKYLEKISKINIASKKYFDIINENLLPTMDTPAQYYLLLSVFFYGHCFSLFLG